MQDPDAQTILERIGDDVAFGLENLAVPRDGIWPRVLTALADVGLDLPLDHSTERLSGGQRQRLARAGALAMRPGLLRLDEPTANLDPAGVEEVRDAVARLVANRTTTLVVVEHRIETWLALVDRVLVLAAGGGVVADGPPDQVFSAHGEELAALGAWVPGIGHGLVPRARPASRDAVLSAHDLTIGYEADRPVRTLAALDIPEGLSTTLTGANGSGKTTLALTLAGLLPPLAGQVQASAAISPAGGRFIKVCRQTGSCTDVPSSSRNAAQVGGPLVGHRGPEGPMPATSQRPVAVCSRAQVTTEVRSSPYVEPSPESYSSSRATPRSRSRTAPALFPRAACVRATQIWARPCHKSRSSPGPAFQRASRTSCAAKGLPSRTNLRATAKVCDGGSGSSETGSTPIDP